MLVWLRRAWRWINRSRLLLAGGSAPAMRSKPDGNPNPTLSPGLLRRRGSGLHGHRAPAGGGSAATPRLERSSWKPVPRLGGTGGCFALGSWVGAMAFSWALTCAELREMAGNLATEPAARAGSEARCLARPRSPCRCLRSPTGRADPRNRGRGRWHRGARDRRDARCSAASFRRHFFGCSRRPPSRRIDPRGGGSVTRQLLAVVAITPCRRSAGPRRRSFHARAQGLPVPGHRRRAVAVCR